MKQLLINDYISELPIECVALNKGKIRDIFERFSTEIIHLCAENAEADVIFYLSSPSPSTEDYEVFILKDSIKKVKDMIK